MLNKHKVVERNSILMLIFIIITISIGGIIEIVPLFRKETTIEKVSGMRPYTPLELAGFNIYLREGCYGCHSQQIRPLRDEVERYGHYSLAAESMFDHPFQWGSKRTGPDLARVGGKYSDEWHVSHMIEPRDLVPESIMPGYKYLANRSVNISDLENHMRALQTIGIPYTDEMIENARHDAEAQARPIDTLENQDGLQERYKKINIRNFDGQAMTSELDALIAYLQVLGTLADIQNYEAETSEGDEQ